MKKKKLWIVILASLVSIAIVTAAVVAVLHGNQGDDRDPTQESQPIAPYLELDQTKLILDRGNDHLLNCVCVGISETVVWNCADQGVATVDEGKVIAVATGETVITATAGTYSATCTVVVQDVGVVPAFSPYPFDFEIKKGKTYDVSPKIFFADSEKDNADAQLTYQVADSSVATIDENGVASALEEGTTTFTVGGTFRGFTMTPITGTIVVKKNITVALDALDVHLYACDPDGKHETARSIKADVFVEDVLQSGAELSWHSDDENIVTVSDGVLTAVRAGQTMVHAVYHTEQGEAVDAGIQVEVERPVIQLNELHEFDLSNRSGRSAMELGKLSAYIDGMFTGFYDITDGKQELVGASYQEKLSVPNSSFPVHGYREYALESELVSVHFEGLAITRKIYTVNDLASIATSANTLDGYYRLEKDIDAAGRTVTLVGGWTNSSTKGFVGTFEGNGHTISNLSVANGGLFYCIGAATIQNLGLANVSGTGNVLATEVHEATIENVVVFSRNCQSVFGFVGQRSKISNVLAVLQTGKYCITTYGSASDSESTVNNLTVVAGNATSNSGWSGTCVPGIFNNYYKQDDPAALYNLVLYGTKEEMLLDMHDNGIPSAFGFGLRMDGMKLYYNDALICRFEIQVEAPSTVYRGSSCTIKAEDATFSLKTPVPGISVDSQTGVVYVASSVPEFTKFTVIVQHKQYEDVREEVTITVNIRYAVVNTDLKVRFDLSTGAETYRFTVDNYTDTFKRLGWQGTIGFADGIEVKDGTFILSREAMEKLGTGDGTLCIYTEEENVFYVDMVLADKFLYTYDDLAGLYQTKTLSGYYMMANDIVCDSKKELTLIGTWTNRYSEGFIGTFNGDGHILSGLKVGTAGLFGYIGSGTVKNVALVNVNATTNLLASEVHGGTFENIFVSSDKAVRVINYAESVTSKNIVAVLPKGWHYIATDGSASITNEHRNVYAVVGDPVTNNGWSGTKVTGLFQHYYRFNDPKKLYNLKHYNTANEMLTAMDIGDLFASWSESSFRYQNGEIYFGDTPVLTFALDIDGEHTIYRGTSVKLSSNDAVFTMETPVNGISVTQDGTVTVAKDVAEHTKFTVIATHKKYSNISVKWEMTVAIQYAVIDRTGTMYDMDMSVTDQNYKITISGYTGTLKAISWHGQAHVTEGISMEGETLVITPAAIKALGAGSGILRVYTQEETAYHLDATVATRILYTAEDLKSIATAENTLDGYYILANDISNCGTVKLVGTWSNSSETGFIGTFDGRGHILSDLKVESAGLFGYIGAGTVQNLALKNVSGSGNALASEVHGATIASVYISSEDCLRVMDYAGDTCLKNIVAVLPNGEHLIRTFGSATVSNSIENVLVVVSDPVTNNGWSGTRVEGLFQHYYKSDDPKTLYHLYHYVSTDTMINTLEKGNLLAQWNDRYIRYDSGVLYFNDKPVFTPPIDISGPKTAYQGERVKLSAPNGKFSLKEPVKGITVTADGTVTVAADVAEHTKFTIIVTHEKYSNVFTEWEMTVAIRYTEIDRTGTMYDMDMSVTDQNHKITISGYTGTLKAISWQGQAHVTEGISMEGETLVITPAAIKALGAGSGILCVYTQEKTAYHLDATVATRILYTAEDLKSIATAENTLDGYYILANDISDCGTVKLVGTWSNSSETGFIGTFDGRGHILSDLKVESAGLFGYIGAGTVQNLALKNVSGSGNALASEVHGATIASVYISSEDCLRVIDYAGDTCLKNIVAVLPNGEHLIRAFGSATVSNSIENVLVVVSDPVTNNGWSGTRVEGLFQHYYKSDDPKTLYHLYHYVSTDTMIDTLEKGNLLAQWNDRYIRYDSGALYFNDKPVIVPQIDISGSTNAYQGKSVKLNSSNAQFSLKEPVKGITVTADGTVTVAADVAEQTEFTVIATHTKYSKFTQQWQMKVMIDYKMIDLTATEVEFDLSTNASRYRYTIPNYEGTFKALGWEGKDYIDANGISVRNGQLLITKLAMATIGTGSGTLCVYTEEATAYRLNVTIADGFIRSFADLKNIATTGNVLDGYYVLCEDIDCNGEELKLVGTWGNSTTTGFIGTFDGRGHSISNVKVQAAGLFGYTGSGTIKDLALVNVQGANNALASEVHGTVLENIFISSESCLRAMTYTGSTTIRNVIALLPNGEQLIETFGSATETNTIANVYTVMADPVTNSGWSGTKVSGFFKNYYKTDDPKARYNLKHYETLEALLGDMAENNTLAEWKNTLFSYKNGKLLFNGKAVSE